MQVLEGPEENVRSTYARISRDPRHHDIMTLREGRLAERDFPEWWMGFKAIDSDSAQTIQGFSDFLNSQWSAIHFADDPSQAHQLLRVFRRM